jgi:hypothetical protein
VLSVAALSHGYIDLSCQAEVVGPNSTQFQSESKLLILVEAASHRLLGTLATVEYRVPVTLNCGVKVHGCRPAIGSCWIIE